MVYIIYVYLYVYDYNTIMPKDSYLIAGANSLIKRHFPDRSDLEVNKTISNKTSDKDMDYVFITTDGNKIIKFEGRSSSLTDGLTLYHRLSSSQPGCNICKLLEYQICRREHIIIIVMENCGEDLNRFFTRTGENKMNFKQLLQLSLDLLKQIICLQHPSDGTLGVVHGDIKPENVAVKVKEDGETLDVRLIDLDRVKQIKKLFGSYEVQIPPFTPWIKTEHFVKDGENRTKTQCVSHAVTIENITKANKEIIIAFLKINKDFDFLRVYSNVPQEVVDKGVGQALIKSLEYLHIIDLCSWCYIVLIGLELHGITGINTFTYNALLLIVMNIITQNSQTHQNYYPIDCFGKRINKDYCDKVVNALTALLLLFDHSSIANETYTDNILKLFFTLIQECSSSDELIRRFQEKPDLISLFRSGAGAGGRIRITRRRRRTLRKIRRTRKIRRRRTHHKKSRMY